jgi:hypothetical protein
LNGRLESFQVSLAVLQQNGYRTAALRDVSKLHQEGTHPMKHQYKSHSILITAWASLDGFTTELRISKETPNVFQSLKINQSFPTKAEAETYALEVAKKRIDNVSPNRPKICRKRPVHEI